MPHNDADLSPRERRRLAAAREEGFLDARRRDSGRMVQVYSRWCWRLKIPLVWCERRSPRSKFGRIRLDMFTTADRLTAVGQAAMRGLGTAGYLKLSPHDACWDRVPLRGLHETAAAVLRAALRAGNCEPNRVKLVSIGRRKPEVVELHAARAASA